MKFDVVSVFDDDEERKHAAKPSTRCGEISDERRTVAPTRNQNICVVPIEDTYMYTYIRAYARAHTRGEISR